MDACASRGTLYTSFLPTLFHAETSQAAGARPGKHNRRGCAGKSGRRKNASSAAAKLLERLDYRVKRYASKRKPDGYFSAPLAERRKHLQRCFDAPRDSRASFVREADTAARRFWTDSKTARLKQAKIFCGFSDLTSVHIFLWQKLRWVTFYGPLVAGGFDAGANATGGYDPDTFMWAMTATNSGWTAPLEGETFTRGTAEGTLLGGCITLIETSIGTPWELDTRGSILLLEDRGSETISARSHAAAFEAGGKI